MPLTSSESQDTQASLTAEGSPDAPTPEVSMTDSLMTDSITNGSAVASGTESASYVKLAMRNMVQKGRKSLTHFFLTSTALLGLLVGLSYLTR